MPINHRGMRAKSLTKSVLVTGANGLLGQVIAREFSAAHWSVKKLVRRLPLQSKESTRQDFIVADITDRRQLSKKLGNYHFRACVHCAALTNLSQCREQPLLAEKTHVMGTRNLVDLVKCEQFVYVSTDSVFDGLDGNFNEQAIPNPLNVYAQTKLAGEGEAAEHKHAVVARLNLYDIRSPTGTTLAEWADQNFKMGKLIFGYENIYFNPLHTTQIATSIASLINIDFKGLIHIGCNEHVSKLEFLQRLAQILGYSDSLVRAGHYRPKSREVRRPLNTTLDTSKLQALLPANDLRLASGLKTLLKKY